MKNHKCHGKGKYTYSDGSYYDGDWKYGLQQGYGVFVFQNKY